MFKDRSVWLAYIIVFVSSACSLILELVAGRIMAPYIGVSLYTWTTIIGVVLAGISLGNYLGGRVADVWADRMALASVFFASGLTSLAVLPATKFVAESTSSIPLIPKIVLFTAFIFFVPSCLMGMTSPLVIKLSLADLKKTGNVVGKIYAISTVGSIFGTFITGFVLVSLLGTRAIVWLVALTLIAMGMVASGWWRRGRAALASLIVIGLYVSLVGSGSPSQLGLIGLVLIGVGSLSGLTLGLTRWVLLPVIVGLAAYALVAIGQIAEGADLVVVASGVVISIGLLLASLLAGSLWQRARLGIVPFLVLLLYAGAFLYRDEYRAPCVKETNYYCINIFSTTLPDVGEVKAMVLDHLVHSYISPTDPGKLGYGYERIYAEMTDYVAGERTAAIKTLFIGGGGYTFPRYIEAIYPNSTIEVAEIDPGVTEAAYDYLGMPRDSAIKVHNQDARLFFEGLGDSQQFDIIYGDAFNDLSVPYHLTSVEFDRRIRQHLKDDGFYLANVIDNPKSGQFLRAFIRTMQQSFANVYLLALGPAWAIDGQSTFVVAGSGRTLDIADFLRKIGQDGAKAISTEFLPPEQMPEFLSNGPAIVLTDDYAPVDQLVAPLFVERGY